MYSIDKDFLVNGQLFVVVLKCLSQFVVRVPHDPVLELADSRVDSGSISVPASDAPADDAGQLETSVTVFDHQRPAAVPLARILAAVSCSGTEENLRNPLKRGKTR